MVSISISSVGLSSFVSVWRTCVRFDGTEYHAMMRAGNGKGHSGPSTLIVDDWRNKETAEKKLEATSLSSCDEAFWEDRWLLILHRSQTAWYATQQNDIDTKTKRKLYWTYIVAHPAHAEISMAQWMGEAHRQALLYLKWCSFGAFFALVTSVVNFIQRH
jgi:hypothetical protein